MMQSGENVLQPLRVLVRARPHHERDGAQVLYFTPDEPQVIVAMQKPFAFDATFDESASQEKIFDESVGPLVDKVLQGYNAAVVAYGHTGTGKTYTMGTAPRIYNREYDNLERGIVPRALDEIFQKVSFDENHLTNISVSFLEVYGNEAYDLLHPQRQKVNVSYLDIRKGVTCFAITSPVEGMLYLSTGSAKRRVGNNNVNSHSSRSHAVFTIHVEQHSGRGTLVSRIDLVDLAGSEATDFTSNKNSKFKEAIHINNGLLTLHLVMESLNKKKAHIPYRSCILTTLLKESLNANSFVVLIVCVSPSEKDLNGTVDTLRFAATVKNIKINPKINNYIQEKIREAPWLYNKQKELMTRIPPTPGFQRKRGIGMSSSFCSPSATPVRPLQCLNNTIGTPGNVTDELFSCSKKRRLSPLNEDDSPSNFSVVSSSTMLDTSNISMALSPVVKKYMQKLEDTMMSCLKDTVSRRMSNIEKALKLKKVVDEVRQSLGGNSSPLSSPDGAGDITVVARRGALEFSPEEEETVPMPRRTLMLMQLDEKLNLIAKKLATSKYTASPEMTPRATAEEIKVSRRKSTKKCAVVPPQERRRSRRISMMPKLSYAEVSSSPAVEEVSEEADMQNLTCLSNPDAQEKHNRTVLSILNKGSLKQLKSLPCIGVKKAIIIINHRNLNGQFSSINGLESVFSRKFLQEFCRKNAVTVATDDKEN